MKNGKKKKKKGTNQNELLKTQILIAKLTLITAIVNLIATIIKAFQ